MAKRKSIKMIVTASVPVEMSASDARREIRTLINEQANYSADPDDVRARKIVPAPKEPSRKYTPLEQRESDTILAALRFWQAAIHNIDDINPDIIEIATNGRDDGEAMLTEHEIDFLCESINCGDIAQAD